MTRRYTGNCTYCGSNAVERDHVTSVKYHYIRRENAPDTRKVTVPSCRNCNATLSDTFAVSIAAKACVIVDVLREKHKVLKLRPVWFEFEVLELGFVMQTYVREKAQQRKEYEYRIEHAHRISKSRASIAQAWAAFDKGITLVEHLYNSKR